MERTRVFFVDDHQVLTDALATLLADDPELHVVGHGTIRDPQLTQVVAVLQPDVITVDVAVADMEPGRLVERLLAAAPGARVVVLTAAHDPRQATDVARAGAAAWVSKQCSARYFVTVLSGVCRGEAFFPADLLGTVLHQLREDVGRARAHSRLLDVLTARECDVLTGMIAGWSSARIATELFLSPHTVRSHIRAILSKLDVHSRLEAVQKVRAAGLAPPDGAAVIGLRDHRPASEVTHLPHR
ncbi:LuxR C-terminal-related transcriptional regulator [Amycolatopsis viridis]|uniref:Two-component system nitrate/nitrite response regulator NarL n=1 Tax=Amycolatopsis viridis TaxID=185678 RepID=A0ABX0SW56_9PSEU|nr:response regulator transcription factor [Amycolatopsis viridis]NIH80850.1 two-component system nitrate/nitrite response regulator NarL [Amycolatopsis viridis]